MGVELQQEWRSEAWEPGCVYSQESLLHLKMQSSWAPGQAPVLGSVCTAPRHPCPLDPQAYTGPNPARPPLLFSKLNPISSRGESPTLIVPQPQEGGGEWV